MTKKHYSKFSLYHQEQNVHLSITKLFVAGRAGTTALCTSQPTNLHVNPVERIAECHLQGKLQPLPGPKDIGDPTQHRC